MKKTHGLTGTKILHIWYTIIDRCYNEKSKSYREYGGRGINVCDRWRSNVLNFYNDMGHKPYGLSIDRIDNNGNYCKENCRRATPKQQAENRRKRRSKIYIYHGKQQTLEQISNIVGIKKQTIYTRIKRYGYSFEEAIK